MIRRLVAGLILVGLAVGIWALWPREDSDTLPTTLPSAVETTASSTTFTSTTSSTSPSSTISEGEPITVEEAEAILRELWFGWFEGIYNQDEERIREVVGNEAQVDAAISQFGQLEASRAPDPTDLQFAETEILHSTEGCLAVWSVLTVSGFSDVTTEGVHVFQSREGDSLFVSLWTHRNDLWEADCVVSQ